MSSGSRLMQLSLIALAFSFSCSQGTSFVVESNLLKCREEALSRAFWRVLLASAFFARLF
jgi:hypothetical protein